MRLCDLEHRCRLFGESPGVDDSLARFREATGGHADLTLPDHREATVVWLRRWGCRTLRVADTAMTLDALAAWAERWSGELHAPGTPIAGLTDEQIDVAARAYEDLASTRAAHRRHRDGLVPVRFGATAAAKALFAVRPDALPPWDEAIRRALGYDGGAGSYRAAIVRARSELAEAAADGGVEIEALPALVGRPHSTPPKLVDEHDWVRYAAGH